MISQEVEIVNKLGLHARAAAKFVNTAHKFSAEIHLQKDGRRVNGKSIMGVMMLAAGKGSSITLDADGADQVAALNALCTLIEERFGELE